MFYTLSPQTREQIIIPNVHVDLMYSHTCCFPLGKQTILKTEGCFSKCRPWWQFLAGNKGVNLGSVCFNLEKWQTGNPVLPHVEGHTLHETVQRGSFHTDEEICSQTLPDLLHKTFYTDPA